MDKRILTESFETFLCEDVSEKTIQKFIEIVAKKYEDAIDEEFGLYKDGTKIITKEKNGGKSTQIFLQLRLKGRMRGKIGEWHKEESAKVVYKKMESVARELETNIMIKNDIIPKINFPERNYKLTNMGGILTVLIMEYSRIKKETKEKNTKTDLAYNTKKLLKDYDFWDLVINIQNDGTLLNRGSVAKSGNLGVIDPKLKNDLVLVSKELSDFRSKNYLGDWHLDNLYDLIQHAEKVYKIIEPIKNKFNKDELLKKAKNA